MSPPPSDHYPGYRYSPRPRKEKTHCSTAAVCSRLCRGTSRGAKSIFMFHKSEQRQTNGLQLLPTKKKKKGGTGSKVFHSAPSYLAHSPGGVIAQSIQILDGCGKTTVAKLSEATITARRSKTGRHYVTLWPLLAQV